MFYRGREKLHRDLDIIRLIKRSLKAQIDHQVQYNENERFLLNFNRKYVICSDSSSGRENLELDKKDNFMDESGGIQKTQLEKKTMQIFKELEKENKNTDFHMMRILSGIGTKRNIVYEQFRKKEEFIRRMQRMQTLKHHDDTESAFQKTYRD